MDIGVYIHTYGMLYLGCACAWAELEIRSDAGGGV